MNDIFKGNFGPGDKVAVESVTKMLLDDPVVKEKLKEYAKTNDVNMFIKSIFPQEFQRVLVECFTRNDEAYNKLLNNSEFQNAVMNIIAKELYSSLSKE